jgi:hypothetical protein
MFGCGPSSQEKYLMNQEMQFSRVLQDAYSKQFANQQAMLSQINNVIDPILAAGPSQQGFSPEYLATLNTQAINTTGANYANAARAVGGQMAGRGSDSGLESGVEQQIKGALAGESAGQLSNEELGITKANYETGRQNFENAVGTSLNLSAQENPLGYAGAATGANQTAFGEADTINQQESAAAGGLLSAGLSLATGIPGMVNAFKGPGGGSSPGSAGGINIDTGGEFFPGVNSNPS